MRAAKRVREGLSLLALGAAAWTSSSSPGWTQQAAREAPQPIQIPEVSVHGQAPTSDTAGRGYAVPDNTTAARVQRENMEIPQSIRIIPRDVLVDQQVRTMDEALATVGGVSQGNTYGGVYDSVILRGFTVQGTSSGFLRNGVRSLLSRNITATTDRVEVLRGPSSMLYGRLEPGGAVNIITRQPLGVPRQEISGQFSDRGVRDGFIDSTGPLGSVGGGQLDYLFILEREDSDYWRDFGRTKRTLVAPSISWRRNDLRLQLSYEYQDIDVPLDRGTAFINGRALNIPRSRRLGERWERVTETSHYVDGRLEYDVSNALTVRVMGAMQSRNYNDYQARLTAVNANTGVATRVADSQIDRDEFNYYLSSSLVGRFATGSLRHEVVGGVDWERLTTKRNQYLQGPAQSNFNVYNPTYGLLDFSRSRTSRATDNLIDNINTVGVFVQDRIELLPNLSVTAGLRYESYRQFYSIGVPGTGISNSDTAVTYGAGVLYRPMRWLSLYANYGTSFNPNSVNTSTVNPAPLPPTEGDAYEVGTKIELGSGWTTNFALFQTKKRNIASVENGIPRTIGEARSRGVELEVAGPVTSTLSLIGAYGYTDTEVLKDTSGAEGNSLPNAARNTASMYGRYTLDAVGLPNAYLGGGVRYVGDRAGDAAESFTLPAYTVGDIFAGYEQPIGEARLRLQLNIRNVGNTAYFSSAQGNLRVQVGEPLTAFLRASIVF